MDWKSIEDMPPPGMLFLGWSAAWPTAAVMSCAGAQVLENKNTGEVSAAPVWEFAEPALSDVGWSADAVTHWTEYSPPNSVS